MLIFFEDIPNISVKRLIFLTRIPYLRLLFLCELGLIFLSERGRSDYALIEERFASLLQAQHARKVAYIILCYLKHEDAILSDSTKKIISTFEADPKNAEVVEKYNEVYRQT